MLNPTRHFARFALAAGALTAALHAPAQIITPDKLLGESRAAVAGGRDPIPGPRTCFWARGPSSGDPYLNIAYPDSATFYWAAVFTVPQGAKLSIEGKYPHSRYISFISYDEAGRPIESVADYLIKPKAGSSNPYLAGADRNAANRDYILDVVDSRPDPTQTTGMNLVGQTRDKLNTPK